MTDDEEALWDWGTEVLGTLYYALEEGDTAAVPPLEDIRDAVECLVLATGWNGLEPHVAPVRRALRGPDVESYAEIARLTERLLEAAKEHIRIREEPKTSVERHDDDIF